MDHVDLPLVLGRDLEEDCLFFLFSLLMLLRRQLAPQTLMAMNALHNGWRENVIKSHSFRATLSYQAAEYRMRSISLELQ